jgi:hypothetical protein
MKLRATIFAAVLIVSATQASAQGVPVRENDSATSATTLALRAAIMGDPGRGRFLAIEQRITESIDPRVPVLSESMAMLASMSTKPAPRLAGFREDLDTFPKSGTRLQMDRLLRRAEPRQVYLEARSDRKFERTRRVYNSIITPFTGLLSGQFLNLLILPAEGIEQAFVGGRYLTPEERRELYTARRAAVAAESTDAAVARAQATLRSKPARRDALARLQARENGERDWKEGRLGSADWWFRREMALANASPDKPMRSAHRDVISAISAREKARLNSTRVVEGESAISVQAEYYAYSDLLRTFLLSPASARTIDEATTFRKQYPKSIAVPTIDALIASIAHSGRDWKRAAGWLRAAASSPSDSPWGQRSRALLADARFAPSAVLADAMDRDDDLFWRFVVSGEEPLPRTQSLDPETARLREASWIRAIRSVFVFDMISRYIATPFMKPFPHEELFDVAGQVPDGFYATDEGADWMRRIAAAKARRKRHIEAAADYRRIGDESMALAMESRAARELDRRAKKEPDARTRAALYQRIVNAFPKYPEIRRVQRELARADREARGFLRIDRDALRAYPSLLNSDTLDLPATLVDGSAANGEIGKDGLYLLKDGGLLYEDRASKELVELPRTMEATRHAAEAAYPMLRRGFAHEEATRPLPRKRIPLALEGGAFPGIDIAPGLVPLEPDPALRRLYE